MMTIHALPLVVAVLLNLIAPGLSKLIGSRVRRYYEQHIKGRNVNGVTQPDAEYCETMRHVAMIGARYYADLASVFSTLILGLASLLAFIFLLPKEGIAIVFMGYSVSSLMIIVWACITSADAWINRYRVMFWSAGDLIALILNGSALALTLFLPNAT